MPDSSSPELCNPCAASDPALARPDAPPVDGRPTLADALRELADQLERLGLAIPAQETLAVSGFYTYSFHHVARELSVQVSASELDRIERYLGMESPAVWFGSGYSCELLLDAADGIRLRLSSFVRTVTP